MKIISKYKDYYDYLQGVYGVDEKLILDRRDFANPTIISDINIIRLYIAGNIIEGYQYYDKFYYGKDIEQFARPESELNNRQLKENCYFVKRSKFHHDDYVIRKSIVKDIKNVNEITKCPILMEHYWGANAEVPNIGNFIKYPKLELLNVKSVLKPHDIWIMLSSWLSSQIKDAVPNPEQTNKEKILAAGFDLKTSFRNVK